MRARVTELMKQQDIKNLPQLSKKLDIPYTTLSSAFDSNFENTKLSNLTKIAKGLNCSLDYLVFGKYDGDEHVEPLDCKMHEADVKTKDVDSFVNSLSDVELLEFFAQCKIQYDVTRLDVVDVYNQAKQELLLRLK